MEYVTLDFETAYSSDYTLEKLTYEEYIRHSSFRVHAFSYKINAGPVHYVTENFAEVLRELFPPGNDNVMIAHNTLFDGAIAGWVYGVYAKTYYCTESMSRCLWNQQPASLESLAIRCFPDNDKIRKTDELKAFKGILRELTAEEHALLQPYACNDTEITFQCFTRMYRWFPDDSFRIMDLTLRMFIQPMFVLDRERVTQYLDQVTREVEQLLKRSPVPESILASNDKFADWILAQDIPLEKIPSPTPKNPNNKKWPLAKNSLEFIQLQTDYPQHQAVWEARLAVKSTQERSRAERLLVHADENDRIALPLRMGAAHTLRFGGTNRINPQNFKRGGELRKCLRAPPGHKVLVADQSNIERRMLAWVAGEMTTLEAFRDKRDVYSEFAETVFNMPINKTDNPTERFVGKVCELGLGYGLGANKLQQTLAVGAMGGPRLYFSLDRCREFVYTFRQRNPRTVELWRFLDAMIGAMTMKNTREEYKCLVFETGRVLLPNGHYINYPDLKAEEQPGGGYAYSYWNGKYRTNLYGGKFTENLIQALSQALIWWQMLEIEQLLEEREAGRIMLQVHDEIIGIVLEQMAEWGLAETLRIMRTKPAWFDGDLVLDAEGSLDVNYSK